MKLFVGRVPFIWSWHLNTCVWKIECLLKIIVSFLVLFECLGVPCIECAYSIADQGNYWNVTVPHLKFERSVIPNPLFFQWEPGCFKKIWHKRNIFTKQPIHTCKQSDITSAIRHAYYLGTVFQLWNGYEPLYIYCITLQQSSTKDQRKTPSTWTQPITCLYKMWVVFL